MACILICGAPNISITGLSESAPTTRLRLTRVHPEFVNCRSTA